MPRLSVTPRVLGGLAAAGAASVLLSCSNPTAAVRPSTLPRSEAASPTRDPGPSTATLLADASKAEAHIHFFTVTGSFLAAGPTGSSSFYTPPGTPAVRQSFELRVGAAGSGAHAEQFAEGWVRGPTFVVHIVKIDNKLFLRGDAGYYKLLGPKAAAVSGRWLVHTVTEFEPEGEPAPQIVYLEGRVEVQADLLLSDLMAMASETRIVRDPQEYLRGERVIPVHFVNHNDLQISAILYFSARSPHLIVGGSWSLNGYPDSETAHWGSTASFAVRAPANAVEFTAVESP